MSKRQVIPDAVLDGDVAILGRKGRGKSIVAKGIAERILDRKGRLIVADPMGHWWGLKSSRDGKSPGYPVAVFGGEHADVPLDPSAGKKLAAVLIAEPIPAVIDTSELGRPEASRFWIDFFAELYRLNASPRHSITIVLEEADVYAPQHPQKDGYAPKLLHEVDQLARRGRARGFKLVTLTQRPARIHKDVISQAGTLIALGVTAPQDRKAIEAWVEGNADDGKAKAVLASLAQLQVGEGWVWHPDTDYLERVRFPMIGTLDTSSTPKAGDKAAAEPKKLARADIDKLTRLLQPEPPPAPAKAAAPLQSNAAGRAVLTIQQAKRMPEVQAYVAEREALAEGKGYHRARRELEPLIKANAKDALAAHGVVKDLAKMLERMGKGEAALAVVQTKLAKLEPAAPVETGFTRTPPASRVFQNVPGPEQGPAADGEFRIVPGHQRILDAIAFFLSMGVRPADRGAVATQAQSSPTSSTFQEYARQLKNAGLVIMPNKDSIDLTEAGLARASPEPLYSSLAQFHDAIKSRLTDTQWRILKGCMDHHPEAVPRGAVAEGAGSTVTSSTFQEYGRQLKKMGFLEFPSSTTMRASDVLFPGGLR